MLARLNDSPAPFTGPVYHLFVGLFMCYVHVCLPQCMHICSVGVVKEEVRRVRKIPGYYSCRCCATRWEMGTQLLSSARAWSAHNRWSVSATTGNSFNTQLTLHYGQSCNRSPYDKMNIAVKIFHLSYALWKCFASFLRNQENRRLWTGYTLSNDVYWEQTKVCSIYTLTTQASMYMFIYIHTCTQSCNNSWSIARPNL